MTIDAARSNDMAQYSKAGGKRHQGEQPHDAYRTPYRADRGGVSPIEKTFELQLRPRRRAGEGAKRHPSPCFVTLALIQFRETLCCRDSAAKTKTAKALANTLAAVTGTKERKNGASWIDYTTYTA